MKKVLFLVSRPGCGHIRCAHAISEALARSGTKFSTEMLDIHDLIDSRVSEAIIDGYLRMTKEQPELYQRLYDLDRDMYRQLSGQLPADEAISTFLTTQQQRWFPEFAHHDWILPPRTNFDRTLINAVVNGVKQSNRLPPRRILMRGLLLLIYRILAGRLKDAVKHSQGDILVATQMYPAALLEPARRSGQLSQPLIGVITDFGVHGVWVRDTTDHYCVPHLTAAQQLRARGVPHHKILVTGMPLMPAFTKPFGQEEARAALDLPSRPTVLVTGGELGVGTEAAVRHLIQEKNGPMVLVTTPRRSEGPGAIEELARAMPDRVRIIPWTDDMPTLMRAADVVIGKPGGLTISESLACGRPFIATCCLGGQEAHNVHFLEQQGAGVRLEEGRLAPFLQTIFAQPDKLQEWQARAFAAGERRGSEAVAQLIRRHAGEDHVYPDAPHVCSN